MLRSVMARTPVLVGLLTTGAVLAGVVHPSAALADSGPLPLTLTVTGPTSLPYRAVDSLQVTVGPEGSAATGHLRVLAEPAAGGDPTVVLDTDAGAGTLPVPLVADVSQHFVVTFVSDDESQWLSPEPATLDLQVTAAGTVARVSVVGSPASGQAVRSGAGAPRPIAGSAARSAAAGAAGVAAGSVAVSVADTGATPVQPASRVWRSFGGTATIRLVDADGAPVPGVPVTLQQSSTDTKGVYAAVKTVLTGAAGTARVAVNPWADTTYRVVYLGSAGRFSPTLSGALLVRPATPGLRVVSPSGSPQPAGPAQTLGRGVGTGANAVVSAIPNAVWASMLGYSWSASAHCPVGRSQLSYILINYWGFDGNRYRGELVVAKNRAAAFAKAFTTLYEAHFPIRSMVRPDRFGHSANGWPGANDYTSMARDNTYAFNCRYVVGAESSRRMSPHAYGSAVDINTWENPDIAANGTHPNAWFAVHRSAAYGGVIMGTSVVVKAMRAAGLGWGGNTIRDYQHFDPTLR